MYYVQFGAFTKKENAESQKYRIENENVIFNKLDNTKNLLPKSSEK